MSFPKRHPKVTRYLLRQNLHRFIGTLSQPTETESSGRDADDFLMDNLPTFVPIKHEPKLADESDAQESVARSLERWVDRRVG